MPNDNPPAETAAARPDSQAAPAESGVLGGRVRLLQPQDGYRAGMDAALLAAAVGAKAGERVLEAGCGVGGAMLQAAARATGAHFTGVERDAVALQLAHRNIVLNGMEERVQALSGDVGQPFKTFGLKPFDVAFANPPYFDDPSTLRGPAPARRGAWLADDGLAAWMGFLLKATREGGRILMIHRADRIGDVLTLLSEGAGSIRVRPIHPFIDAPAKRVLVQGIKTGRAPLLLLPPLVLHKRGAAKHTPLVEAILRGETPLEWN